MPSRRFRALASSPGTEGRPPRPAEARRGAVPGLAKRASGRKERLSTSAPRRPRRPGSDGMRMRESPPRRRRRRLVPCADDGLAFRNGQFLRLRAAATTSRVNFLRSDPSRPSLRPDPGPGSGQRASCVIPLHSRKALIMSVCFCACSDIVRCEPAVALSAMRSVPSKDIKSAAADRVYAMKFRTGRRADKKNGRTGAGVEPAPYGTKTPYGTKRFSLPKRCTLSTVPESLDRLRKFLRLGNSTGIRHKRAPRAPGNPAARPTPTRSAPPSWSPVRTRCCTTTTRLPRAAHARPPQVPRKAR